jgi:penicillin-binding protein 1A
MGLFRRIVRRIFGSLFLALVTFVGAPLLAGVVVLATLIFLPLPATIPLAKANPVVEPSTIYDAEGQPIATLSENDEDVPVAASQIPAVLEEAVIADEDRNFFHEGGVDLKGILRAFVADVRNEKVVQGGSTITEQYVKLAYTSGRRDLLDKIREAILASQLDREASKNEILYRYLTTVYFGDGNYGIGAAAQDYFHVGVSQLDASEAATLAGLIPAPSDRAPREDLAAAEEFRRVVLDEMLRQGYLTRGQYRADLAQHLALAGEGKVPPGATVVYPQPTETTAYPAFVSYVTAWLLERYPASEVYGGGLRVQTTLQPVIQQDAQSAVDATLSGTADPLEMGLAAVQPQTGFIEALVGHRSGVAPQFVNDDFALGGCPAPPPKGTTYTVAPSCLRHPVITGGGGGRQPGSSWKPFVLATAFEQGIPPTKVYSAPPVYEIPGCTVYAGQPADACQIHNDEGSGPAEETLAEATAQSTNTVYAQVAPEVGCANVARTAEALGVTSAYYSPTAFPHCESYALGELGVSPLDMASAYGVFADHGERAVPTPVLEILSESGKILVDHIKTPPRTTRVLAANIADNVTSVLQGVITSGTGTAAALGRPAAGKTGTASNYTNAWFVGYTPSLSAAVWMGDAASESVSIGDVKGVYPVVGGTWPARTWRAFMEAALAGVPTTGFSAPAPIVAPRALVASTPTTAPSVEPGDPSYLGYTSSGGPYVGSVPSPYAPPPAPTTTTTTTLGSAGGGAPPGGGPTTTTSTTSSLPPPSTTPTTTGIVGGR